MDHDDADEWERQDEEDSLAPASNLGTRIIGVAVCLIGAVCAVAAFVMRVVY